MKKSILLFILGLSLNAFSQVTVNSLEDLLPYLQQDNVDVKLAPGTYSVSAADIISGTFSNPLFLFEGSNSTYDFTDATINIDTNVFQSFGSVDVKEIQILGNDNVLKSLTMVDIGNTRPSKTALAIAIDGRDNRIEGFNISVRGSHPYGYGDAFGKGSGYKIKHYKHSGVLIRGLRNHLKDCNIVSRSYGHIVFMQAASYPIIEGCYIEGEMRSTDDMLTETSGQAFDLDFQTVWGYKLPAGYMMSLQEEGIRAYSGGTTYIDGVEITRGTDNPTVLNCTVKNARGGVTLAHATGTKYVEGCTVLGCEQGYSIGSGTVVNCGADAIYGTVYKNTYTSDSGYVADITILPPSDDYYNGNDAIAYVGGSNHNLTFRSEITDIPSNLKVMVAGDLQNLRLLNGSNASQNNHSVNNVVIKNLTNFPMVLHSDSSNVTGESCGSITDNGTNNNIIGCDEVFDFPDSNKVYRLGNNRYRAFAAANGGNNVYSIAYHADIDIGSIIDFENLFPGEESYWVFTPVDDRNGYFYIDCYNCGSNSRIIATTNSGLPVLGENTVTNASAQWTVVMPAGRTTYHITNDNARILGANTASNQIILSGVTNTSNQSRFEIIEVSGVTLNIEKSQMENDIALYPIPVFEVLNVKLKNVQSVKVEIIALTGQVLISKSIKKGDNQINLSNIKSGVYLVRMYSDEGAISKKIVKK